jgi:hypothetical protein
MTDSSMQAFLCDAPRWRLYSFAQKLPKTRSGTRNDALLASYSGLSASARGFPSSLPRSASFSRGSSSLLWSQTPCVGLEGSLIQKVQHEKQHENSDQGPIRDCDLFLGFSGPWPWARGCGLSFLGLFLSRQHYLLE